MLTCRATENWGFIMGSGSPADMSHKAAARLREKMSRVKHEPEVLDDLKPQIHTDTYEARARCSRSQRPPETAMEQLEQKKQELKGLIRFEKFLQVCGDWWGRQGRGHKVTIL